MSIKKRFLEHLESKGAIPKGYAVGGMVRHDDDEWEDGEWNDHDDTSGEPVTYGENYMKEGYAFGGRINVPENSQKSPGSLHGDQYGRPNFKGPSDREQTDITMSDDDIKRSLAQSLIKRKQLRGTQR